MYKATFVSVSNIWCGNSESHCRSNTHEVRCSQHEAKTYGVVSKYSCVKYRAYVKQCVTHIILGYNLLSLCFLLGTADFDFVCEENEKTKFISIKKCFSSISFEFLIFLNVFSL